MTSLDTPLQTDAFSLWYCAPEVLLLRELASEGPTYNTSADIWAAGLVAWEVFGNKPLFPGDFVGGQLRMICSILGAPEDLPIRKYYTEISFIKYLGFPPTRECIKQGISDPLALGLISSILQHRPSARPTARQILASEYLTGLPVIEGTPVFCDPPIPIRTISEHNYEILWNWAFQVAEDFKLDLLSFQFAIRFFDQAQAKIELPIGKLQLFLIACLSLGVDMSPRIMTINLDKWSYICDRSSTGDQINQMRLRIIEALDFNLQLRIPYHYHPSSDPGLERVILSLMLSDLKYQYRENPAKAIYEEAKKTATITEEIKKKYSHLSEYCDALAKRNRNPDS